MEVQFEGINFLPEKTINDNQLRFIDLRSASETRAPWPDNILRILRLFERASLRLARILAIQNTSAFP